MADDRITDIHADDLADDLADEALDGRESLKYSYTATNGICA